MNEGQALALLATAGSMVLVGASMLNRRIGRRTWLRLASIWLAIFGGLFLIVQMLGITG